MTTPSKPALERQIGRRIRSLRQAQGLTLQSLAVKAALSKGFLSRIENGRVSSPIATLSNIAAVLGTAVGRLIGSDDDERCVVVRRGQGRPLARAGKGFGYRYEALGYRRLDKRMEPFLVTYPPGLTTVPAFAHPGEGFLFVLRGTLEFRHGDVRVRLRTGDSVYFDNEIPHGGLPLGTREAVALVITAAGR